MPAPATPTRPARGGCAWVRARSTPLTACAKQAMSSFGSGSTVLTAGQLIVHQIQTNSMSRQEAAEILRQHNEWRRDRSESPKPMPDSYNPTQLGIAIDMAVEALAWQSPDDALPPSGERVLVCLSFGIVYDESRQDWITIQPRSYDKQTHHPASWAVLRSGAVMSKKDGGFSYEPIPSSRTKKFLVEHRFASPEEAFMAFKKFHNKQLHSDGKA